MRSQPRVTAELRGVVEGRQWYHTIDLGAGLQTPGFFDHRGIAAEVLPASLDGKRCLDIATFDGFWAIEMNRRGAGEVVALDVADPAEWDWPFGCDEAVISEISARRGGGDGFRIATDALGLQIERVQRSVYDLDVAEVGEFDLVYVGSLLLHLRDPVRALERVRTVCRGELLLVENVDQLMTALHPRRPVATLEGRGRPWWWRLNLAALRRVVTAAGFDVVGDVKHLRFPAGRGRPSPPLGLSTLRHTTLWRELLETKFGDPHVVLHARPRASSS